jgi:two-component system, cell cycle response regulator
MRAGPESPNRILLVDDDSGLRDAVSRRAQLLGYAVDAATSPLEALSLASTREYAVVLASTLPGGGVDALIERFDQRGGATSFIVMSPSGAWTPDSAAAEARIAALLVKPIDEGALAEALERATAAARYRTAHSLAPLPALNVLLIEDSPTDALRAKLTLEELGGFMCMHVMSLADALVALNATEFDVVITDLNLPDGAGLDAVLRVRERAVESALIVCSGVEDDDTALQAIQLGAHEFLSKGNYDAQHLGRVIGFARVRRQAERRLVELASIDPVTGLWNRSAFSERLREALSRCRRHSLPLSVLYIDLDGFKAVNDAHGHEAGDELLRHTALRLKASVRDYDVVARLGGDEFAVLATELEGSALANIAARMTRALAEPIPWGRGSVSVAGSVGTASFPRHASDPATLVRIADEAMYETKRAGKAASGR